ncbi:transposase-like protein [Ancylobacter sp. 3268]|uniref:DUF1804 family protein n=1 Tax=Ancylobacter sp. 3268 TaxID=2817752 RepID=UPI0028627246|nr:DUF1804 family protein [Ancylobacter sp. 3268]MDR6952663.1 transposase-like protein [Ancylobacter sp. 3268]
MAHDDAKKRGARRAYVMERRPLPTVAIIVGVPETTLRRWKREARDAGDDWDTARAASMVSGDGLDTLLAEVVEDYVVQHKATIDALKDDRDLRAGDKAKILASLADSFNKTIGAAGRISPQISQLGVAMDVLKRLGDFIARKYPAHVPAFIEIIEPFGETLPEAYK